MLVSTSPAIWTLRCSANDVLAHGNSERPYRPSEPVAALAGRALVLFHVFPFIKYEYLQVPISCLGPTPDTGETEESQPEIAVPVELLFALGV